MLRWLVSQSAWRGFQFRVFNEEMLDVSVAASRSACRWLRDGSSSSVVVRLQWLALRRMDRAKRSAARKFQAVWRGVLVRRRFRHVHSAAMLLQRCASPSYSSLEIPCIIVVAVTGRPPLPVACTLVLTVAYVPITCSFFSLRVRRQNFVKQQVAVRKLQAVARGYLDREKVRTGSVTDF
jgi:hypothetical protein